ncbi:MAG: hypothetical protein K2X00_17700 [Nitrospiraceae bacterium]|nr:hypothetical protein [Nitrospiraceae bacterium]
MHTKNLDRLADLKEKMHTVETPSGFDMHDVAWALKEGRSQDEVFAAITTYLRAQAEGFHFAESEFKTHSHVFDQDLRDELKALLTKAKEIEGATSPFAKREDRPLDDSGLKTIDAVIQVRRAFIHRLYECIDVAIDRHREALG